MFPGSGMKVYVCGMVLRLHGWGMEEGFGFVEFEDGFDQAAQVTGMVGGTAPVAHAGAEPRGGTMPQARTGPVSGPGAICGAIGWSITVMHANPGRPGGCRRHGRVRHRR